MTRWRAITTSSTLGIIPFSADSKFGEDLRGQHGFAQCFFSWLAQQQMDMFRHHHVSIYT